MTEFPATRSAAIIDWLRGHVRPNLMAHVSRDDLGLFVHELLFGERDMWAAALEGIVTKEEACLFLLAHVDTWVLRQVGQSTYSAPEEMTSASELAAFVRLVFGDAD